MSSTPPAPAASRKRVLSESAASQWWAWYLAAIVAACLIPVLIVLLGLITKLLEDGGLNRDSVSLGGYLAVPIPRPLLARESLEQLAWLVGVGLTLAVLQSLALYLFYRGLYGRTRSIVRILHENVLATSVRVAEAEGITAQRHRTAQLIDRELPKVRDGLIAHWRANPRSIVLTILCTALAICVDVWLTLAALISGLIVWVIYRWLHDVSDAQIARFDWAGIRRRLVESAQTAPVVARVRGDEKPVDESGGPLGQLIEATRRRDQGRARLVPITTTLASLFIALLLMALGANMLVEDATINLPAALVLVLSLVGAVTGATRIIHAWNSRGEFQEASDAIYAFIDRANSDNSQQRMGLSGQNHGVELDNVTILDGAGRVMLDKLTLRLPPASIVAVMGTEPLAVGALVDLVMGFGTPKSGRARIGNVDIGQLHQRWLSQNVLWVGDNGPIWSGTISENLGYNSTVPNTGLLSDAARRVGVYDRIQSLPDGFSTLISADDDRIDETTRYGLATARAWLRRPAVLIVQEPPVLPGTLADDTSMDALRELADAGSLVIVLPRRLQTLRKTSRVILLNGGQLAGEGKHEQLLAESDLYRHLNYVLFNPYRHTIK